MTRSINLICLELRAPSRGVFADNPFAPARLVRSDIDSMVQKVHAPRHLHRNDPLNNYCVARTNHKLLSFLYSAPRSPRVKGNVNYKRRIAHRDTSYNPLQCRHIVTTKYAFRTSALVQQPAVRTQHGYRLSFCTPFARQGACKRALTGTGKTTN